MPFRIIYIEKNIYVFSKFECININDLFHSINDTVVLIFNHYYRGNLDMTYILNEIHLLQQFLYDLP